MTYALNRTKFYCLFCTEKLDKHIETLTSIMGQPKPNEPVKLTSEIDVSKNTHTHKHKETPLEVYCKV